MYESGHSEPRDNRELRDALRQLEEALARHERELPPDAGDPADPALQILHRSIVLMRQEADRLRVLLGA